MKKVKVVETTGKRPLEGVQAASSARATARIIARGLLSAPARAARADGVVMGDADEMSSFFRSVIEKTNNHRYTFASVEPNST